MAFKGALDGAVSILLNSVAKVLPHHNQYLEAVQSQIIELVQQVKYMQGYVADVEKIKGKHKTVEATLNALRELLYDADDLVIECLIHADYQIMRDRSCSLPSLGLFRNETVRKLKKINRKIREMSEILDCYSVLVRGQPQNEGNSIKPQRWASQVFDQSQIIGSDEDVERIKSWILPQNEGLHRVGVIGAGGLGKTTLCRRILEDKQVRERFNERIWLSISKHFSETDIIKKIQQKLGPVLYSGTPYPTYLIVLDDVCNLENGWLDQISLGMPGTSNCMIFTSRIEPKGMEVVETTIYHPKPLESNESWSFFCKVAFMFNNGICNDLRLHELGKHIVKNCFGLPLAIKLVGGSLCSKKQPYEWKQIFDKFNRILALTRNDSVMASLLLSYEELPTHLKNCILSFSVFPEDHEIGTEQLVRWWVGEGFVHKANDSCTEVEMGFGYLTDLISRCLVEVVEKGDYGGRVFSCKVNPLVRELTLQIAKEEAFSKFGDKYVLIPTSDSRRVAITSDETKFHDLKGKSKLRALLLLKTEYYPLTFNMYHMAKVNSIRVLDLSQVTLHNVSLIDFWDWICSLKRLVYLNLGNVWGLRYVPNSIGKLWGLQTLILTKCMELKYLPASIGNLFRLKVLDLSDCSGLSCLPKAIKKLENLEELYGFKVPTTSDKNGCQLLDLRRLTNLRALHVEFTYRSIIEEDDLNVLQHHDRLKILSIDAVKLQNKEMVAKLDRFCPPRTLEELYVIGYHGETIPQWINPSSLPNLKNLCLRDCSAAIVGPKFFGDGEETWKVEGLSMVYLIRLKMNWNELKTAMPSLRYMKINRCYWLQDFPCEVDGSGDWRKNDD